MESKIELRGFYPKYMEVTSKNPDKSRLLQTNREADRQNPNYGIIRT